MCEIDFIRDIIRQILNIKDDIHIYFSSKNYDKNSNNNTYSIMIRRSIEIRNLGVVIYNTHPLTQTIDEQEYEFKDISEDEVNTISNILFQLGYISSYIEYGEMLKEIEEYNEKVKQITESLEREANQKDAIIKLFNIDARKILNIV
ncbi:MAG: hypothetical protein ACLS2V_12620 [Clostridium paraputrificum]|uniref:hypothetical protein n=1 Tax=Clostridium sp. TaxID=1506 RepID=UPI0025BE38F2|nr:hypothetical protein [Clostridium sp.]MBS5926155.1 hypothetical protein [Clostridium sp.]